MRLSKTMLRGPVEELSALTPEAWDLEDEAGPFRFEITARPPTRTWERYLEKLQLKQTEGVLALRTGDQRKATKVIRRELSRPEAEKRRDQQKRHDMVRAELIVSMVQVFTADALHEGGRRAEVTGEEVEGLLRLHSRQADVAWCTAATESYEPEETGGDNLFELLARDGEPLSAAIVRFATRLSNQAARQRRERDEEEVLGPLPFTPDSGPGSKPAPVTLTQSGLQPVRSTSVDDAENVNESGSLGVAETARVTTS